MLREEVLELLSGCADLEVSVDADGDIDVCVLDFEGFDESWDEVMREYDEESVDAIYSALESSALEVSGDFYRYFDFDGFCVQWGYASMDI